MKNYLEQEQKDDFALVAKSIRQTVEYGHDLMTAVDVARSQFSAWMGKERLESAIIATWEDIQAEWGVKK